MLFHLLKEVKQHNDLFIRKHNKWYIILFHVLFWVTIIYFYDGIND